MKYGRYAVRFRVPNPIPGYKAAWLLWRDDKLCQATQGREWPYCGEVDFPETDFNSGSTIAANMHRWAASASSDQDHLEFGGILAVGQWHTAVMEWTPTAINFTLDGVKRTSTSRLPQEPMRYIMQTEVNTSGAAVNPAVSGNVQVDWVAIYSRQ